jgi:hypothetical protein
VVGWAGGGVRPVPGTRPAVAAGPSGYAYVECS